MHRQVNTFSNIFDLVNDIHRKTLHMMKEAKIVACSETSISRDMGSAAVEHSRAATYLTWVLMKFILVTLTLYDNWNTLVLDLGIHF